MSATETLVLSRGDLERLATMDDVIAVVESVFKAHGRGQVIMPPKISLNLGSVQSVPGEDAFINAMPAFVGPLGAAGIKWVGVFGRASARGLPRVTATLILNDPETGAVRAIMEAGWITAARTGAATAVAARYLARPASVAVGIVGAGVQGEYQLRALSRVLDIRQVMIYDIRGSAAATYASKMSAELGLKVQAAASAEEAICAADVVVTATSTQDPFLDGGWLQQGCLVCALGSHEEIRDNVIQVVDKIIVDSLEQAKHRGSLAAKLERGVLAETGIYGELGEIVAGKRPGREQARERILLCPIGMGSEDVAVAAMLYERAKQQDLGLKVDLLGGQKTC